MKTSGLFTVHTFEIPVRHKHPFKIIFFGDVHRDSPNHASGAWKDFLSYAKAEKNAYFFGMGDYVDSASTSERSCLTKADLHESTANDLRALAEGKVSLLAREMAFMKGRLIGLLNGNHYFQFQDGTNTDMRLCMELNCKYLGVSSFVRLRLADAVSSTRISLDIWAHHGTGAGRLLGGSINRVDQMREHAESDLYAMGHDHKRGVVPATPRLYLDASAKNGSCPKVRQRQQWLIRSGSFLRSYEDGEANYNVDAGRGPCSLGHIEIIATPHIAHQKGDATRVDIRGLA